MHQPSPIDTAERLTLAGLVVFGLSWRASWATLPPNANELQNVAIDWTGPLSLLTAPESAVNPPLWRAVFTAVFSDPVGLSLGRATAVVCSVAAAMLAWWLVRPTSRGMGLLAAAVLLLHPQLVEEAAKHRAYAAWSLAALGYVGAMSRVLDGDRRSLAAAALAAVAMAWLHYLSVPILAVWTLALGWRAPRAWVPSVVGLVSLAPLAAVVLGGSTSNVAPPADRWARLAGVLAWGGSLPSAVTPGLGPSSRGLPVAVVLVVCAVVAAWRATTPIQRVLAWGWLGAMGSVLALGQVQAVRNAAIVVVASFGVPALATLPRTRVGRVVLVLCVTVLGMHMASTDQARQQRLQARWAVPWAVARVSDPPGEVAVLPVHRVDEVEYAWWGRRLRREEWGPCPPRTRCSAIPGGRLLGAGDPEVLQDVSWVLAFGDHRPPDAWGCRETARTTGGAVWRCVARSP